VRAALLAGAVGLSSLGLALALPFALAFPAMAAPIAQPSADWVARVGSEPIPRRPADALLALARRERPELTLGELTRHLAVDLLMGDAAAREVGDATLFASRRVGFPPELEIRRQWLVTLQALWPDRIDAAWRAASPELPLKVDAAAWRAVWPDADASRPGSSLRMDDALDAAQLAAASRVVVLRHRAFGGAGGAGVVPAGAITLGDLWPLQNVQGRRLLRGGDLDFARAQARQLLRERFVEHWLRRESGWQADELDFVHRVIEARQRKLAWQRWSGLSADPHGDAPPRDALAAAVSPADIERYYRAHQDRFERLEAVEALHVRCLASGEAQGGPPSACAAPASLRGLAGAAPLNWRLGDAEPDSALDAWARDLARAWPVGPASPPIRHPDGAGWERVQVLSTRRGVYPVDSETVRHEARQALALERLDARWRQRQKDLLDEAGLRWAPGVTPPRTPFEPPSPMAAGDAHAHAH